MLPLTLGGSETPGSKGSSEVQDGAGMARRCKAKGSDWSSVRGEGKQRVNGPTKLVKTKD